MTQPRDEVQLHHGINLISFQLAFWNLISVHGLHGLKRFWSTSFHSIETSGCSQECLKSHLNTRSQHQTVSNVSIHTITLLT